VNRYVFNTPSSFKLTSFRLMNRRVVKPLFEMNVPVLAPNALLCMITTRMINVEVDHEVRTAGRSGYSLSKLIRAAVNRYLGFSVAPLRALMVIGFIGVLLSVLLGAFMLFKYMTGQIKVAGWTTVVLLLLGSMGFNFLGLGILGEYLQNVLLSVRQMPAYLVRQHIPAAVSTGKTGHNASGTSDGEGVGE